jgi:dienelactone hydrolase
MSPIDPERLRAVLRGRGASGRWHSAYVAHIAFFHSVLGVRPGITDAATRFRDAGHEVQVVDQYDGRVFDDYREAGQFATSIGYLALMQRAVESVADVPDGFVAVGFSNGGGMAEWVATRRQVAGVLMLSGALDLAVLGVDAWPAGVPAQIHYTENDPFRHQEGIDSVIRQIKLAGASIEVFNYPGSGHLFTDASLPQEYDEYSAGLLWSRALAFCRNAVR